jgi:hypothetical protein
VPASGAWPPRATLRLLIKPSSRYGGYTQFTVRLCKPAYAGFKAWLLATAFAHPPRETAVRIASR